MVRAAILEEPKRDLVVVDDVEIAGPLANEVIVNVSHCGICGTDLHIIDGDLPFPLPVICGHEVAGTVAETGEGVTRVRAGDTVVVACRGTCGRCYWCVRNEPQLCAESMGWSTGKMADGNTRLRWRDREVFRGVGVAGFAESVVTPEDAVIRVASDTPTELAAVLGCAVQTGVGAVLNTAQVEEGSTALIIGLGGVGTSTVLGTRIAGASQVIGVDPLESRRNRAVELGLTSALDPSQVDVGEAVREQTGGIGVDYAFETVGRPDQSALAFAALRAGGLLVMVGVPGPSDTVTFPAGEFVSTERRVSGCFLGSANPHREIPRLLELWRQGNLPLEGLITGQYQLTDINLALGDARSGKGLRTVLNIGAG